MSTPNPITPDLVEPETKDPIMGEVPTQTFSVESSFGGFTRTGVDVS